MCLKLGYSECSNSLKPLVGTYDTWSQKPKVSFNTVRTQILPHGTKYCMTHKKMWNKIPTLSFFFFYKLNHLNFYQCESTQIPQKFLHSLTIPRVTLTCTLSWICFHMYYNISIYIIIDIWHNTDYMSQTLPSTHSSTHTQPKIQDLLIN